MMSQLFRKPIQNRSLFVMAAFLLVSVLLNGADERFKYALSQKIISQFIKPFQDAVEFYSELKDHRMENLLLKRQVTSLSLKLERYEEAKRENERLRNLLGFQRKSNYPLFLSSVVGNSGQNIQGEIIVSGGRDKKLIKGMPVVTEKGVVGRIEAVYDKTSLVRLLYAPGFAISGRSQRSRVTGVVKFVDGHMIMENVTATQDIQRGDRIITSGLSETFPPGLPIGFVEQAENIPGSLFKKIIVQPYAELDKLEEVFVMLIFGPAYIEETPDTILTESVR